MERVFRFHNGAFGEALPPKQVLREALSRVMKVSDYVMNFIHRQGVRHLFGYQGGSVTHLIDSLHNIPGLNYVQNYHEQASAFCADAYSRITNNIGVALVTSGPGATNLITGIANAFFDSIPCLFITGQVSTHALKKNPSVRQRGFQETDIVGIATPITKYASTVLDPERIRYTLEKAFFCARVGRPGPVLIDIPHNVQAGEIDPAALTGFDSAVAEAIVNETIQPDDRDVRRVADLLASAKRPVILVGGGMSGHRNKGVLKAFAASLDLPIVSSLRGLDCLDHDDDHFSGFIGSYGNRYANFTVAKSDLLLVLGSRLDERQTGEDRSLFARDAQIIRVDIDPHELNHTVREALSICSDCEMFLKALQAEIGDKRLFHMAWRRQITNWKEKYPSWPSPVGNEPIDPNEFIHVLSTKAGYNACICADVGQNMMWVAQSFHLGGDKRFLCSAGHGAMGYSLPAGIGAQCAESTRQKICIMGDGGIQMNLQELQTVSRDNLPLKIFVMNNASLGMVRGFQEKYFNNRCFGSVVGYSNPEFEKLAYAFDIKYTRIRSRGDYDLIDDGLAASGPHFFEVVLSPRTQVIPEPAPRRAVEDQLPLLDRKEFDDVFALKSIEKDEEI